MASGITFSVQKLVSRDRPLVRGQGLLSLASLSLPPSRAATRVVFQKHTVVTLCLPDDNVTPKRGIQGSSSIYTLHHGKLAQILFFSFTPSNLFVCISAASSALPCLSTRHQDWRV